ncbi:MAG: hypothetical protein WBW92_05820 [Rhodanobacteraceae bacterium]
MLRVIALLLAVGSVTTMAQPGSTDAYLKMFDLNGDRRISQAEYLAYMRRGFQAMDRNGDGILEGSEMPHSSHRRGPLTAAEHQRNLIATFRRQDLDHDGFLDSRELSEPPH